MCTLIVIRNAFPGYPLVVAANRDEKYDRPSAPPRLITRNKTLIYAPQDLKSEGTWIGVSEHGVFAGITNRRYVQYRPRKTSRGHLVMKALTARDANSAMQAIMLMDAADYNGFQMCIADRQNAYVVRGDSDEMQLITLGDRRITVLTENGIGLDGAPRAASVLQRIRIRDRHHGTTPHALDRVLSYQDFKSPEASVCTHSKRRGHGTRSSTVVRMDAAVAAFDVWHREGPPREARFGEPFHMPFLFSGR